MAMKLILLVIAATRPMKRIESIRFHRLFVLGVKYIMFYFNLVYRTGYYQYLSDRYSSCVSQRPSIVTKYPMEDGFKLSYTHYGDINKPDVPGNTSTLILTW